MIARWRYRVVSVVGTLGIATFAVFIGDMGVVHEFLTLFPVLDRLPVTAPKTRTELVIEVGTGAVVVLGALIPLYKPRPRRILDTILLAQKRTLMAIFALATIGYFDYTYRLPRLTLIAAGAILMVTIPGWFVAIRWRPRGGSERAIIIGDDPGSMAAIIRATDTRILGYVSPPTRFTASDTSMETAPGVADGGVVTDSVRLDELECLGGLSRLEDILVEYDIDAAMLAFAQPDRAEFFGALDTCHEHGVRAKVHRDHADHVLIADVGNEELVDVDLEPWDLQDYLAKRAFDIGFALVGLIVLSPVMAVIAVAVKLDSSGPVLYRQERTAEFGETFTVHKFRSMVTDAEADTGTKLSEEDVGGVDPRVTRVGRILRRTHLDEIPQLWSILVGDMSVVGPRPERPELDREIEEGVVDWRRRWFIKPGLTGLAQINEATGFEPGEKLRYDIEYVRRQSFWFDLKIVARQIWQVVIDAMEIVQSNV